MRRFVGATQLIRRLLGNRFSWPVLVVSTLTSSDWKGEPNHRVPRKRYCRETESSLGTAGVWCLLCHRFFVRESNIPSRPGIKGLPRRPSEEEEWCPPKIPLNPNTVRSLPCDS
jgi:hypothetical protein